GDDWQQFANLRLLFSYMFGHLGDKMIFMGGEFAQRHEWKHDFSLDWHEAAYPSHQVIQKLIQDLNELYQKEPAFYVHNFSWEGFEWIDIKDATNSVFSWVRKGIKEEEKLVLDRKSVV